MKFILELPDDTVVGDANDPTVLAEIADDLEFQLNNDCWEGARVRVYTS